MIADTLEELHAMAGKIGLNRCWYDPNPKHPHYDLYRKDLVRRREAWKAAIVNGAKHLSSRELIVVIQSKRNG